MKIGIQSYNRPCLYDIPCFNDSILAARFRKKAVRPEPIEGGSTTHCRSRESRRAIFGT
jgi:hypothetical protein